MTGSAQTAARPRSSLRLSTSEVCVASRGRWWGYAKREMTERPDQLRVGDARQPSSGPRPAIGRCLRRDLGLPSQVEPREAALDQWSDQPAVPEAPEQWVICSVTRRRTSSAGVQRDALFGGLS